MEHRLGIVVGLVASGAVVTALACEKGGDVVGTPDVSGGPSLSPLSCQPGCTARPADGRAALDRADVHGALEAYRCADTPEAAFGAGISAVLAAVEGESMNRILADLGQGGLKATDFVGPSGLFGRHAARWNGSGSITRTDGSGATLDTLQLTRGRQAAGSSGYASARWVSAESLGRVSLSWSGTSPVTAGQRIGMGCSVGGVSYPSVTFSTPTVSCYSSSQGCDPANGAIVVNKTGSAPGDAVEYTLDNVLVSCTTKSAAGTNSGSGTATRLSGTLTTVLSSDRVDLTGLSPVLSSGESWAPKLPASVPLEKLAASASGVAGSLELASCYLNVAGSGAGDGKVFEVPAGLVGTPITLTRGDAKVLSAFAALAAGAVVLVQAYRLPLELRGLICGGGADGGVPCLSSADSAARVNAGIGALADRQKIEIARRLVGTALASLVEAPSGLGASSLFVKNELSAASIDKMRTVVEKLKESLDRGSVALPFVAPELRVDLKAFFDSPPDPDKIPVDPMVYDAEREGWVYSEAFFDQAVPASSVNWHEGSSYTFDDGRNLVLDPMGYRFEGYFPSF
jgi:hypothetical protein